MSDSARRTVRTVFALVLSFAANLPLLVHTAGLSDTLPGVGGVLAVAAAITHVMALPGVDAWLPSWLRMAPPQVPMPPAPAVPPLAAPPTGSRE
ncbi:hypothetical protein [Kitasatospora sp. NPDC056531]|uniref:hypothetical protein n=1 Tax=Kitasatospora sp. NPDC056531 TaxID=3345856 RepID=UPI0036AA4FCA